MDIGIVGGGINGICCAWHLACQGHEVTLYERDKLMGATSRASSKLLHGGLRYLENAEFRLVREALIEREAWLRRNRELAKPLRIVLPIYKRSRRSKWKFALGFFLYDLLARSSTLPKVCWKSAHEILGEDPELAAAELLGGFVFWEGQMDDYGLGHWVAEQAKYAGVAIMEGTEIQSVRCDGTVVLGAGTKCKHDRIINVAGPWALQLLQRSGIECPYELDLVRGSHLILQGACRQAYLCEAPEDSRLIFVLPWNGKTLLGTTEVRQTLEEPVACTSAERDYLLNAYAHYFPTKPAQVVETFAGLRPVIRSASDPSKATREYAIHRTDNLLTVVGGKWTTAMALAARVAKTIH